MRCAFSFPIGLFLLISFCSFGNGPQSSRLAAQAVSELPRAEYYLAKEMYGSGRVLDASDGFAVALTRARRVGEQRWIDSIPPLVMLGECHYHQGNLAAALEQYDAALMLLLANPDWIDQIDVGVEQLPVLEGIAKGIDWFPKSRPTRSVQIPESVQIGVDPTQAQVTPQGNLVAPISLITRLDATEVLRTLTIALARRWQLLGPLAKHSPLSDPLVKLFRNRPAQQAAWVNASWTLLSGLSQLSSKTPEAARGIISNSILLGNQFDYFLSARALLTLAEMDAQQGNFQAAIVSLQDASLLAAQYEQHDELSDSFSRLAAYASASHRIELLEPLQRATNWSNNRSSLSQLAATTGAVELAVIATNFGLADKLVQQSNVLLRPREMALPRFRAQLAYASSLLAFGQNRKSLGLSNLETALKLMHGSAQTGAVAEPVFQAQMTLDLLASGALTQADCESILDEVLAEPGAVQWQTAPLTTLATITTSSLPAYERWLAFALLRQDSEQIVRRVDRLQQQVFFESLPLGGRLFSWRQAVASAPEQLPPAVREIVTATLQRYPALQNSGARLEAIAQELRQRPIPLDERTTASESKKLFAELKTLTTAHENGLAFQTLGRKPLDRYLPADIDSEALKQQLAPQDLLLAMVVSGPSLVGVAASDQGIEIWQVDDFATIDNKLKLLLVELGLVRQPAGQLPSGALLADAAWRTTAGQMLDALFPEKIQKKIAQSKRVILAPYGRLWYIPFELLPTRSGAGGQPWLTDRRVTYVPTLGSYAMAFGKRPQVERTVGIIGSMFAIDRSENEDLAQQLVDQIPNSAGINIQQKITVAPPVWLRMSIDRVWVGSRLEPATRPGSSLWDTVLFPLGKARQSQLGNWLQSPLRSPVSVVLPGYQTSMLGGELGNGNEIFLPVCGLLHSGTESLVISRWPAGGRSSFAVLGRFLNEQRDASSSAALRRSILALWPQDFLVADEPSLLPAGKEAEALTQGSHPLLWAGYLSAGDGDAAP